MTFVLLPLLLATLALSAYIDRVYSEMGKFLAREYQDNIDAWEERVEPRLHLGRESVALSASVLRQLSLAAVAFSFGLHFYAGPHAWVPFLSTSFELILLIVICDRLVPQVLFTRTRGVWIVHIRLLLQALFYLILPVTLLLSLLLSITALAEPEDTHEEEHPSEAMDALLEAGEEEGILEESDRELVRSVVEFGDKVVREVMTPRPEIFAVPASLTLKQFTAQIREHAYSRVPVFRTSVDDITGIVFAHDLLHVSDADSATRTVAQIQRPAAFVPETKMVAELLREMQREKQHMRIVIDEYGGVAGIITIEDLIEAIIGNIADEHDEPEADDAPIREPNGSYVVGGSFELSRLRDLFAEPDHQGPDSTPNHIDSVGTEDFDDLNVTDQPAAGELVADKADTDEEDLDDAEADDTPAFRLPDHYESTTLGGLVSELAGHIPLPGEVIEESGLRLEVLASTDRRIDRIRVSLADQP
jgi:CBS domain containing-hemolysin-like protein